VVDMTEFLVEHYRSQTEVQAAVADGERARAAAESLACSGTTVRLVRSIFVPDDETCFLLFEAESADAARAAMALAGLPCDEIHETAGQVRPQPIDEGV
jgi:Protein of unknown function (DUF4242)